MRHATVCAIALLTTAMGCASTQPSRQLLDARRTYQRAAEGPATRLTPAALYEARAALMEAEDAQRDHPDSLRAQSLAYIADRRAAEAMALADQSQSLHQAAQARQQEKEVLHRQRERALEAEKAARAQAEQTARQAVESLSQLAKIRLEPQRTVITLTGQVLFPFGKATLLPTARAKLDQVATALKTQPSDTMIVVNGYTDSVGDPSKNMELSRRRAESVRDELVAQGIAPDRVQAFGYGAESPIASNATPEGRADNRRVEIVVKNERSGSEVCAR